MTTPRCAPAPRTPQNSSGSRVAARVTDAAVGRDDLDAEQVVDRPAEAAAEVAEPAAEREPGDADARDEAERRRQAVPLRGAIDVAERAAGTDRRGARRRVDLDGAQPRHVERQPARRRAPRRRCGGRARAPSRAGRARGRGRAPSATSSAPRRLDDERRRRPGERRSRGRSPRAKPGVARHEHGAAPAGAAARARRPVPSSTRAQRARERLRALDGRVVGRAVDHVQRPAAAVAHRLGHGERRREVVAAPDRASWAPAIRASSAAGIAGTRTAPSARRAPPGRPACARAPRCTRRTAPTAHRARASGPGRARSAATARRASRGPDPARNACSAAPNPGAGANGARPEGVDEHELRDAIGVGGREARGDRAAQRVPTSAGGAAHVCSISSASQRSTRCRVELGVAGARRALARQVRRDHAMAPR